MVGSGLALLAGLLGVLVHNARLRVEVERAEKQSRRADANYRHARETVRRMLAELEDRRLADLPRVKELRQKQLEQALAFYQAVVTELDSPDPAVRFDLAIAYKDAGAIEDALGRPGLAGEHLRQALALYEQLAAEHPDDLDGKAELAGCCYLLGRHHARQHAFLVLPSPPSLGETEYYYRRALQLREELRQAQPDVRRWQEELATSHTELAGLYARNRQPDLAGEQLRAAHALRVQLLADGTAGKADALALANVQLHLGLDQAREDPDKGEEFFRQSAELLRTRLREDPHDPDLTLALAELYRVWGGWLTGRERRQEALDRYAQAIGLAEAVLRQEPQDAAARDSLAQSYGGRAYSYRVLGRYAEAVKEWDHCIEMMVPKLRNFPRSERAAELAHTEEYAGVVAEADAIAGDAEVLPEALFNAACALSLAARSAQADTRLSLDKRAHLAADYAARAVALLRRLQAAGFFKGPGYADLLRIDKDFDALRTHKDFQALQREVGGSP